MHMMSLTEVADGKRTDLLADAAHIRTIRTTRSVAQRLQLRRRAA